MSSGKRRAADPETALERIQALSDAARHIAPNPCYLDRQGAAGTLMTERQREVVVKYINELAEDFELSVQTGTLACNYFDRYMAHLFSLNTPPADKRTIQMTASTSLLIAAKFSDRKLPPLSELEKVHHGKARAEEFAALELKILQGLHWKLHVPLPHAFTEHLRALCGDAPFNSAIEDRMLFFIDLSVYGYPFLQYTPAAIAAAAVLTAWKFSELHECCQRHIGTLARAVDMAPRQLSECVTQLMRYFQSCFPESAEKAAAAQTLFIPIPNEPHESADTPTLLRRDVPVSPADGQSLPDSDASSPSPTPRGEGSSSPAPAAFVGGAPFGAGPQKKQHQQPGPNRYTPDSITDPLGALGGGALEEARVS